MESKCINLIKHNNSLQNCYNEMKEQLETLLSNYEIINKSKDKFIEYDNIIKLLKKENDELKSKLGNLSDKKDNDGSLSNYTNEYVADLEGKCQELLSQNQELQGCYDELKDSLEMLLNNYKDLKTKSEQGMKTQEMVLELTKQLDAAKQKNEMLLQYIEKLDSENSNVNNSQIDDKIIKQLDIYKRENEMLHQYKNQMEDKYNQFIKEYKEYSEKILVIENEYVRVRELNEKYKIEIGKLNAFIDRFQNECAVIDIIRDWISDKIDFNAHTEFYSKIVDHNNKEDNEEKKIRQNYYIELYDFTKTIKDELKI